jgi:hypothetical protein
MSDDDPNTHNKNVSKRMAAELAELEDPIISGQAQLDHWWRTKLEMEAEERRLRRELNPTGLKIW